jgi:catechol 2,3-dioxygenase-like lactoylglutathione lyase family enzyme
MLADRRVHAILPVPDVEAARPFYEDVLGLAPDAVVPNAVIYGAGAGSVFAISRSGGRPSGAHTQMAFTVADVPGEVAALRARGVAFEEYDAPRTVDGVARMPFGYAAWFKDPNGNTIGIVSFDDGV